MLFHSSLYQLHVCDCVCVCHLLSNSTEFSCLFLCSFISLLRDRQYQKWKVMKSIQNRVQVLKL